MLKNDNTSLKLHTQDLQGQLGGSYNYSHSKNLFFLLRCLIMRREILTGMLQWALVGFLLKK